LRAQPRTAKMADDNDDPWTDRSAWSILTTGRSSNDGLEAWVAQPDGSFAIKSSLSYPSPTKTDILRPPLSEAADNNQAAKRPTMAEIKAAGRERAKAAKDALAAEQEAQQAAGALWEDNFDFIFDSTSSPALCSDFFYKISAEVRDQTVLVVVPGFASWSSLTRAHVEQWKSAALLDEKPGFNASRHAMSVVLKWPCGKVKWASADAYVEAAAAWQEAHEATLAAARSLTLLLQKLKALHCRVVVAGHSLGARVALQALANDLAAPPVEGLVLLGSAVDNHSLTGLRGTAGEVDGIVYDGIGAAPAEFPFNRLMNKVTSVALAHSTTDPTLAKLWQPAEHARCGRSAPSALGLTGLVEEELEEAEMDDESWMERVQLVDVTAEMSASTHDPMEYLATRSVRANVRRMLFP